jgi:CDP-diacylglycerol--glycerol-3-phosphate 3-phosphatidyltransferase
MQDSYFAFASLGLTLLAIALYGVRVVTRGAVRYDRTEKVGGTALMGLGAMDLGYWAATPIARACVALGLSPNTLTWISLVLGAGAGAALSVHRFGLATMLAFFSTIGDILDGQVARIQASGSDRGELLDASVDRYTEFFFLGGLVVCFRAELPWMVLTLAALLAAFMVSYATAKAEALKVPPPKGPMRRHERSTYLITGLAFSSMFGGALHAQWSQLPAETPLLAALVAVAIAGNYSAVLRLVRTGIALR